EMGIVYAPDFVINAGGVINVADEMVGYKQTRAMKKVENIYDNLKRVFEISKEENIPTYVAADRMAEERIENISHLSHQFRQPKTRSEERRVGKECRYQKGPCHEKKKICDQQRMSSAHFRESSSR